MYTSHLKVDKGDEDKEESEDEETKKRKKHTKISDQDRVTWNNIDKLYNK